MELQAHREDPSLGSDLDSTIGLRQERADLLDSYNLRQVSSLRSVYSIRLYEMLCQYRSVGTLVIGVDEFRERLDLGDKYQRFTHLKSRVIVPAVEELRAKSNLDVTWRQEKLGRKVEKVVFDFQGQV